MIDTKELREVIQMFGSQAINEGDLNELLDRLEAAEKTNSNWIRANAPGGWIDDLRMERNALHAHIKEMEKQEPVRHEFQDRNGTWHPFIDQRHYKNTVADGSWPIRALYLTPGAQPAPSVPDLLESLRCACNYIDKLGGVSQQYRAMLATAPEAKL